jgi:hypothetical protein
VLTQYEQWTRYLLDSSATRWPSFRDAWTVWEWFHSPTNLPAYRTLQLLSGCAVLFWCLRAAGRALTDRARLLLTLSLGLAWLSLFGPAVEYSTYVLLAPVLIWALIESFERRLGRPLTLAAFLLVTILGAGGIERALAPLSSLFRLSLPIGAFLFVCWLLAFGPRVCRPPESTMNADEIPPIAHRPIAADEFRRHPAV